MATVDSRTVANRREVHLATLDDLEAETERIIQAAKERRIQALGNWTAAQVLEHVAKLMEFSMYGFPYRYPLWTRLRGRLRRLLGGRGPMAEACQPGFRNPPIAMALEPSTVIDFDRATRRIREQFGRLRDGQLMEQPSPDNGPLTHDEWVHIHLRHAAMHFSFIHIKDS